MAVEDAENSNVPSPRSNPDLIGHAGIEAILANYRISGHMPQALILAGPRGIGKATLAYRFARWLLAGGGTPVESAPSLFGDPEPGPVIDSLHIDPKLPVACRIAAGGHADLMTVERTLDTKRNRMRTEILVDDARAIAGFLHLTPAEGGWRVVIVDGAEEMNRNAANAILKILEEPPRRSLLILVTHAPGRLLPTIRSRCRTLRLQSLAEEEVILLLGKFRPDLDPERMAAIAALAQGSIGRALELAEADGIELYQEMTKLLSRLPDLDGIALHRLADRVSRREAETEFDTLQELLLEWLERVVIGNAVGEGEHSDPTFRAEPALVAGEAGRLDRWVDVWEKLKLLFARAESINLDRKQVVLDAFFLIGAAARTA